MESMLIFRDSYKWVIDKNNSKYVDIELETSSEVKKDYSILIGCLIMLAFVALVVGFFVIKFIKSQNVNDI